MIQNKLGQLGQQNGTQIPPIAKVGLNNPTLWFKFNPTNGGGRRANSDPPSMFTLIVTKIANRMDSNSNCKFSNICCDSFETI
jgi:hypothetical protein